MSSEIAYRGGRLYVEGVSVEQIAAQVGTPVYIYSASGILRRFRAIRTAFARRKPLICYALKANPNLAVCRLLARAGAGADVVSGGELLRALKAGIPGPRIVFSGVGKTREEMSLALRWRLRALNVESAEEMSVLAKTARRCGKRAPVVIRVNPDVDAGTHAHITTGTAENKFGVDARQAFELYRRAQADPWLRAVGMQCHIGSQILRVAPYQRAVRALLSLLARLSTVGIQLRHLDIGGGMGIAYGTQKPFTPAALAKVILPELNAYPDMDLLLEPGRYLVGESGLLATRVLYRKTAGRRRFVIVDAAMTDLLRPALYGAHHDILPVKKSSGKAVALDIVGPVCETADTFASGCRFPDPAPGELLAILQAGAYGFSMSSHYNSRPRSAEVLVGPQGSRVIRRRETLRDITRHER